MKRVIYFIIICQLFFSCSNNDDDDIIDDPNNIILFSDQARVVGYFPTWRFTLTDKVDFCKHLL